MFCPKESMSVKSFEVWPGFSTAFSVFKGGSKSLAALNVDLMHKIITNQNVLEKFLEIKERSPRDYEQQINQEFIGNSIMTQYNR